MNTASIPTNTIAKPERWCKYVVKACYAVVAINAIWHIIWFFAARDVIVCSTMIYWRDYIILSSFAMLVLNIIADFLVNSRRIPLIAKEYTAILLIIFFCFYLCLRHKYTSALLGTFVLPVFASTIFSNLKMTRSISLIDTVALFVCGIKYYIEPIDS